MLNGGLEERYALAVEVPPEAEALTLEGDASLLRRALLNLVNNCVRHNPEGCAITLTAAAEGEVCTLRVEDDGGGGLPVGLEEVGLAPDGGAATAPASGWWSRSPGPMAAHWSCTGRRGASWPSSACPCERAEPPDAMASGGSAMRKGRYGKKTLLLGRHDRGHAL